MERVSKNDLTQNKIKIFMDDLTILVDDFGKARFTKKCLSYMFGF
jgi:hypothetical protein